jgi:hypothetical protein
MGACLVDPLQHFSLDRGFLGVQKLKVSGSRTKFGLGQLVNEIVKLLSIRHDHLSPDYGMNRHQMSTMALQWSNPNRSGPLRNSHG